MNTLNYFSLKGPCYGLNWSNPAHCVALETAIIDTEGTLLWESLQSGDQDAYDAVLLKTAQKVSAAAKLRRMAQGGTGNGETTNS